jgi:hypothetical protein
MQIVGGIIVGGIIGIIIAAIITRIMYGSAYDNGGGWNHRGKHNWDGHQYDIASVLKFILAIVGAIIGLIIGIYLYNNY